MYLSGQSAECWTWVPWWSSGSTLSNLRRQHVFHQKMPTLTRDWRWAQRNAAGHPPTLWSHGPKDQHISLLRNLWSKHHHNLFACLSAGQMSAVVDTQETTGVGVGCVGVNPLQCRPSQPCSPGPTSLLDDGDLITSGDGASGPMNTVNMPGSGSCPLLHLLSIYQQNNHTALHQTYHLDAIHSPWGTCCNNQANQWQAIVIPQIIPAFLKNCAVTESGWLLPSPQPPAHTWCQCTTVALTVDLVTWDHMFLSCPYWC